MLLGAALALVIAGVGLVLVLASAGASSTGIALLELGVLATALLFLLALFSVITTVSVLGVSLGVAALTIVLAVTNGFQQEFRDRVLGVHAHVIVMKSQTTFAEYRDVMKIARTVDSDVLAVQPFILTEMLATRGAGTASGVAIKGIDPALVRGVLDLDQHMIAGTIDALAAPRAPGDFAPIIMGNQLAAKLHATVGDSLRVVAPLSNLDLETLRATSSAPRTYDFRVAGIFYSGFDEFDRRFMYASLADVQRLVGRGDQVMGVELKVKDIDRTGEIVKKLDGALGGSPYEVQDWYQTNENLFKMLRLQKLTLVVLLTLIIIVAAVNMVSSLTLMVTDKTREIAILKAMGARSPTVARVFQCLGLYVGALGTAIGLALGLVTCFVASLHGYRLDAGVYMIDHLPVVIDWFEVILVAVVTVAISLIATWVPARSAASLRPIDGLRYD